MTLVLSIAFGIFIAFFLILGTFEVWDWLAKRKRFGRWPFR